MAAGRERPYSDVDVAVYLDASVPPDQYLEVSLDLPEFGVLAV